MAKKKKKRRFAGRPRCSADPRMYKRGVMLTPDELDIVDHFAEENGLSRSGVLHKGALSAINTLANGRKLKVPEVKTIMVAKKTKKVIKKVRKKTARDSHAASAFSATEIAQLEMWRDRTGIPYSTLIRAGTLNYIGAH
jgi:hypothetical protein